MIHRETYYKLVNRKVVACRDVMEWGRWYQTANRVVGNTKIGNLEVSTVFLGLDHNFGLRGPPVLWETMVFKPVKLRQVWGMTITRVEHGKFNMERCSGSIEQAEEMHRQKVLEVEAGIRRESPA